MSISHPVEMTAGSEPSDEQLDNHIRKYLGKWCARGHDGVYVETVGGKHKLMVGDDICSIQEIKDVKRSLSFSTDADDLSLFIQWLQGRAKPSTRSLFMACTSQRLMTELAWRHGVPKVEGKTWELRH